MLDKIEDKGVSPVVGVILLVAIVVILAAVAGVFLLGGFDNEKASFSGVETSDSEFSVVKMQSAERLIFKRSDGKLYYADKAGEKITPKSGEYTIIAQSKDGSKNVLKTNIKAKQQTASITIDSFDNSKATVLPLSNNVEKDVKLINLKNSDLVQGRYTSPIKSLKNIKNITVETGTSHNQDTTVSVLTNFKEVPFGLGGPTIESTKYNVGIAQTNSGETKTVSPTGTTKKIEQEFYEKTSYGESSDVLNPGGGEFEQEVIAGEHVNSVIVRVKANPFGNRDTVDIERITVSGETKGDSFDTPRPLGQQQPVATIVSTNSPFNESEGDTKIKITGKVGYTEGNFTIAFLPPEEERGSEFAISPVAIDKIVSVQEDQQKTIKIDTSALPCVDGRQSKFGIVEVEYKEPSGVGEVGEPLGEEKRWTATEIKDTVTYEFECESSEIPPAP